MGAARLLRRKRKVAPTGDPSAASEQQLSDVGEQAEKEVESRCKLVRLVMAERRIVVLAEIKFHGSKHKRALMYSRNQRLLSRSVKRLASA